MSSRKAGGDWKLGRTGIRWPPSRIRRQDDGRHAPRPQSAGAAGFTAFLSNQPAASPGLHGPPRRGMAWLNKSARGGTRNRHGRRGNPAAGRQVGRGERGGTLRTRCHRINGGLEVGAAKTMAGTIHRDLHGTTRAAGLPAATTRRTRRTLLRAARGRQYESARRQQEHQQPDGRIGGAEVHSTNLPP
jgi:hypothetical protein